MLHVEGLQQKFILKQGQWYSDGLDWTFINDFYGNLLERIQNECDRANIVCNLRLELDYHLKTFFNINITFLEVVVSETF